MSDIKVGNTVKHVFRNWVGVVTAVHMSQATGRYYAVVRTADGRLPSGYVENLIVLAATKEKPVGPTYYTTEQATALLAEAKARETAAKDAAHAKAKQEVENKRLADDASEKEAKRLAKLDHVANLLSLAAATTILLDHVKSHLKGYKSLSPVPHFAQHREALLPLAKSLGYSIVLVGDRSVASLVKL